MVSFTLITVEALKYSNNIFNRRSNNHSLLKTQNGVKWFNRYGAIYEDGQLGNNTDLDFEASPCRWTIFTLSRIMLSITQVYIFTFAIHKNTHDTHNLSSNLETDILNNSTIYVVHLIVWVSDSL
jgi:hypothetical protein